MVTSSVSSSVNGERVEIKRRNAWLQSNEELLIVSLMLKKQATSAEDPVQEDQDAAGVTSVEEIGV